jgi:hypothetical protein
MIRHQHVHLKLDQKRDIAHATHRKRYTIYVLNLGQVGGRYLGTSLPLTTCGMYKPERLVDPKQRERVTCPSCLRLMADRFPKTVNPRSGMAMPRPGNLK